MGNCKRNMSCQLKGSLIRKSFKNFISYLNKEEYGLASKSTIAGYGWSLNTLQNPMVNSDNQFLRQGNLWELIDPNHFQKRSSLIQKQISSTIRLSEKLQPVVSTQNIKRKDGQTDRQALGIISPSGCCIHSNKLNIPSCHKWCKVW